MKVAIFLNEVIGSLNDNAGAWQAIFAAVVAIFTAVYVIYTQRMWKEMRISRFKLEEPNIQISLEPEKRWGNLFDLVIKNIGNVPVYDLKIDIEPSGIRGIENHAIEEINLFKNKMPVFSQGQELRTFVIDYSSYISLKQPWQITFKAKYETPHGKGRQQAYTFDMKFYEGMSASNEKTLNDIVKSLGDTNQELKNFVRALQDTKDILEWTSLFVDREALRTKDTRILVEAFADFWKELKAQGNEALLNPSLFRSRFIFNSIADHLRFSCDKDAPLVTEIRKKLYALSNKRFYIDGGKSASEYMNMGDDVLKLASDYLKAKS